MQYGLRCSHEEILRQTGTTINHLRLDSRFLFTVRRGTSKQERWTSMSRSSSTPSKRKWRSKRHYKNVQIKMLSYPLFFLDTRSNKSKRTTSVRSPTTPSTRPSLSTLRPFSSLTSRRKNRSNPLCLKDNKSDKRKPTKRTSSSVCQWWASRANNASNFKRKTVV